MKKIIAIFIISAINCAAEITFQIMPDSIFIGSLVTISISAINLNEGDPDFENETAGEYLNRLPSKNPSLGLDSLNYKIFKPLEQETKDNKKEYFKVRLTSKKTGKKFDINLKYKMNHNETKEGRIIYVGAPDTRYPDADDSNGGGNNGVPQEGDMV